MFFTPKLIEGVNKTLRDSNYSLITFLTNDSYKREEKMIEQCLAWAVEGVLISLSEETKSLDHLVPFKNSKTHCVLLDKTLENDSFPTVNIDGSEASYHAIDYLIKKGHQHILGIFGNPDLKITKERIKGFKKALAENNIPIAEENIITVEDSQHLDAILPPVLKHNRSLSAVFTMSDELLSKSHFHITSSGLSIPNDLSLMSISDGVFPNLIFPKITYLKHAGSKIGSKACRLLLKLLSKEEKNSPSSIILSTKLVEQDSVSDISNQ